MTRNRRNLALRVFSTTPSRGVHNPAISLPLSLSLPSSPFLLAVSHTPAVTLLLRPLQDEGGGRAGRRATNSTPRSHETRLHVRPPTSNSEDANDLSTSRRFPLLSSPVPPSHPHPFARLHPIYSRGTSSRYSARSEKRYLSLNTRTHIRGNAFCKSKVCSRESRTVDNRAVKRSGADCAP